MNPLHLTSLNHVSMVCTSLEKSMEFYINILGFAPIRRPGSFSFNGAWLFNYGIGIHLLQSDDRDISSKMKSTKINPKDNHISFQCESMWAVEKRLEEMGIEYVRQRVEEEGIYVDQLFFHDPDGFMIEICNCDNLPVVPLSGSDTDTDTVHACRRVRSIQKIHVQGTTSTTTEQEPNSPTLVTTC